MIKENWTIPNVLFIQYLDIVTGQELIDHSLAKSGDARFDGLHYIIGDWSQVKKTDISADDVKTLIACLIPMSKHCPNARNASIVKRNETGLSLAAWYRHLGDTISWEIDIFHDVKEAFSFYELDYPSLHLE